MSRAHREVTNVLKYQLLDKPHSVLPPVQRSYPITDMHILGHTDIWRGLGHDDVPSVNIVLQALELQVLRYT